MNLAPVTLSHGERFGSLTVLKQIKTARGQRYLCGCECGFSGVIVSAGKLMKGTVKACLKCSSKPL